jgi:type I restriction enzyme, S subunit
LLEGLEAKEISVLETMKTNDFRLEAEFYIVTNDKITNFYLGKDVLEFSQYNSAYGLNIEGNGYPIIRMNEFDNIFIGNPTYYFDKLTLEKINELRLRKMIF